MSMKDFFNPYNVKHIKAYQHLMQYGCWPVGFIPVTVNLSHFDFVFVQEKLAEAWVSAVLNHSDGMVRELVDNPKDRE